MGVNINMRSVLPDSHGYGRLVPHNRFPWWYLLVLSSGRTRKSGLPFAFLNSD
jgi:hypothetical protein